MFGAAPHTLTTAMNVLVETLETSLARRIAQVIGEERHSLTTAVNALVAPQEMCHVLLLTAQVCGTALRTLMTVVTVWGATRASRRAPAPALSR